MDVEPVVQAADRQRTRKELSLQQLTHSPQVAVHAQGSMSHVTSGSCSGIWLLPGMLWQGRTLVGRQYFVVACSVAENNLALLGQAQLLSPGGQA